MTYFIVQLLIHLACFGVAFYALDALDFNRFMKQGRVIKAQILYIVIAMALGFLMAQFLLKLSYTFYY